MDKDNKKKRELALRTRRKAKERKIESSFADIPFLHLAKG